MSFFDTKFPIIQAPIGSVATTELVSAVAIGGGIGSLAMTWTSTEQAVTRVRQLKSNGIQAFFINYVLNFIPRTLDVVLEEGVPAVSFSWGQPGKLIARVQQSGALAGVQVGTVDGAKQALDSGADFIICQGLEAGGHVQSTIPLFDLLDEVVEVSQSKPVIAAGGLTDGSDLYRAMKQGAKAIMLGTRFIATTQSNAHPVYKKAIVNAGRDDSVYTLCFDGDWPYAAHRVLRNPTLNGWEDAGCPPSGKRPNEAEVLAHGAGGRKILRYSDDPPLSDMHGKIIECCLYAGTGCARISDIPDAAKLLCKIWSDYQNLLNE